MEVDGASSVEGRSRGVVLGGRKPGRRRRTAETAAEVRVATSRSGGRGGRSGGGGGRRRGGGGGGGWRGTLASVASRELAGGRAFDLFHFSFFFKLPRSQRGRGVTGYRFGRWDGISF